jgi:tripartite-type tricarboxylate transporter receptor subunit TctC
MSLVLDRYGILDKSRSRLRRAEVPGIGHAMGSTGAIGERPTFNRPNIERPNAHWEENMLKLPRRRFLHLAAGAAALPVVPRIAMAQAFPTRPVRIVVPFAAGGATDIIARLIGQWLSERLGQQFVIENRPGAGSNIGTEMVVNAPPDGYTLLQVGASSAINATLYEKLSFNFLRDIAPVSGIISIPFIMAVNPSFPAKTVSEFIAYARANPGKVNMASGGNGTAGHLSGELFKMMAGINMVHVPYRGEAPALTDMLGGQVQAMFGTMPASIEYVRAGKLRPLAVTSARRSELLPDLPTLGDFVPGYETSAWQGIGAPKNTPAEIINKLNEEINAGLADPKIKTRVADMGGTVLAGSPADFGKLIADETEKWGKVVKFSGAKPD